MGFFRRDKDVNEDLQRSREALPQRSRTEPELRSTSSDFSAHVLPDSPSATEAESVPAPTETRVAREGRMQPTQQSLLDKYRANATTVAKDTAFSGTLKSDGNLCIEGNFDGELEASATVFVAETANVKANIRATDVIVAGTIEGTVHAGDRFQAMPSARVSGEINSKTLVVEQGSRVNCQFAMKAREEKR